MKDCIHIEMCKYYHRNKECPTDCSCYKSGDIVKVVRCKDCKHWRHMEDGMGDCTHSRFYIDGVACSTMMHDEFCKLGERRD